MGNLMNGQLRIVRSLALVLALLLVAGAGTSLAITYTPIDEPLVGSSIGTVVTGISGSNIVGFYGDSANSVHGFLYDGSTYKTLDNPLGIGRTYANGISGGNVVGQYYDSSGGSHGFLYNGTTYTTLDDPLGAHGTLANGISGGVIVGSYNDSSNAGHGFVYNGSTYTTFDIPLANGGTSPTGISGSNIVGRILSYARLPLQRFDLHDARRSVIIGRDLCQWDFRRQRGRVLL